MYDYKVDDDRLPEPYNKPIARGDTDSKIYKYVWNWNGIYHERAAGFDEMQIN